MAADYKSTIHLPKTDFPMKADLPKREPGFLERWKREAIFKRILDNRSGAPIFAFHDGPPYANGHIHQGHTLNKILKDMVVKYKTMAGFKVDFVPGWDCHGLPIETALEKELGPEAKHTMGAVAFRQRCREYASKFVGIQSEEFQRLGVFGRFDKPYLTMSHDFEATIAREFGRFVGNGGAYKGLRPVHWCWSDQTALAEAEVEYEKRDDPSIYVKFDLPEGELPASVKKELAGRKPFVVIWTTTPWTLPANLAIAMHPDLKYVFVEPATAKGEAWLLAEGLLEAFAKDTGAFEFGNQKILATVDPKALENKNARHPFLDRASRLVLADYVTLDAGTGCVHTAPGHGADDFATGRRYGLETIVPVNDAGVLTADAGPFAGLFIFDKKDAKGNAVPGGNGKIVEALQKSGHLVAHKVYNHDYPHCWRCKKPVIFRATTQWFISMEKNQLREEALAEIDRVKWIPGWGRDRIHNMIATRPDWCISRQRKWGVPIVAFRCVGCGETHTTEAIVERVAKRFESEGADAWYAHSAQELLGQTEKCPKCGKTEWKQEEDILDVWFESGVSWAAVCEPNPNIGFPVDLYLEGGDQHRGWFHSTLLAAVGTRGKNAYKQCLTHGWVVDGKGEKLSKSKGNYIALDKVMEQSGADILRLWVSASDYREDVRLSNEIMERIKESYFKIRNSGFRNVIGKLFDFDPAKDRVPVEGMLEMDRWLLGRLARFVETVKKAYEEYDFHIVYREAVNLCAVDLSAFYSDRAKDRLYCAAKTSRERRSAQTALFEAVSVLARALAPVLAYTCEEAWAAMPAWPGKEASVHLAGFPEAGAGWTNDALAERWDKLLEVRAIVLKRLEEYRAANKALFAQREEIAKKKDAATDDEKAKLAQLSRELIGNADEAKATVTAPKDLASILEEHRESLREAIGASALVVDASASAKDVSVSVAHAPGSECARCRRWYETLAGELCARCAGAVKG